MGESFRVERGHKICARAVEYTDKIGTRPNPTPTRVETVSDFS